MSLIITIKVTPSSGRQRWASAAHGVIKCYLKSPPEKGKANAELLLFLASSLGVSANSLDIVSGASARLKRVKINATITYEHVLNALGIEVQNALF